MPLAPGTLLGPYEIQELLGAGGMGEVYRARDTRLDRTVAVKVLLSHAAERPDARQRFEREARVISSLNHPHICSLYDVGIEDGKPYLVMEYLEGETLAKRLQRGALPLDQVLRYGVQIADALSQAHRQGVFHRDLKPGNIMLTRAGAKLLDFGLAKLGLRASRPGSDTVMADETLTAEGSIVGTVRYMAPEQLEGKEIDGRADLFSLGAVLYELATGRRAFPGDSSASIIAAILGSEPPPVSAVVTLGQQKLAVDRLIQKCLAKNADDRWQTARDVTSELQWLERLQHLPPASESGMPSSAPRRDRLAWVLAGAAMALALVMTLLYLRREPASTRPARFGVAAPENSVVTGSIAVSPDGRQIAFVTRNAQGSRTLWVRPLDSLAARQLPGTEGALHPFWSPDSRFVGFFAQGKLQKIRAEGGPPQPLCSVFEARGGSWSRAGVIVFSPNDRDPLYRVSDGGGAAAPVTSLDASRQESSHQWPHFLPDGRRFLYLVWSAQPQHRGIYVGSVDGRENQRLLESDWGVAAAGGQLLFLRGTTLMAQPFDPGSLRLTGEPTPAAEQVWYDETTPGLTSFSVSDNGVLAYRSGGARRTQLVWMNRRGEQLETVGEPGAYRDPVLSPDEKRVVVPKLDPQTGTLDLWSLDWSRAITARLTFHPLNDGTPLWSPDGGRIVFYSDRQGPPNLYQKSSSGAGEEEPILQTPVSKYPTGWTQDGRLLVYASWGDKTKWDLWVLKMGGEPKPEPYLVTEFDSFQAVFSPDGRWIAYTSNETNQYEVYVQPYPMSAGKWRVSTNGGAQPSWRRDGRELYYLAPDHRLMAVEVKPGAGFEASAPQPLFAVPVTDLANSRNQYVPGRDGQRFLVNRVVEGSGAPIAVAVDWSGDR
jgi:serine/threonine protein kinase/Tol biopolymer transport system component